MDISIRNAQGIWSGKQRESNDSLSFILDWTHVCECFKTNLDMYRVMLSVSSPSSIGVRK